MEIQENTPQLALEQRLAVQGWTWGITDRTKQLTRAIMDMVEQMVMAQEKIKKKWITQETMRLAEEKRN